MNPVDKPEVAPCPDCKQIEARLAAERAALAGLESQLQDLQDQLSENARDQGEVERLIADLKARLQEQQGIGASSFDPSTGITISSYDQGNGQVKIVTQYPDGSESVRFRPRRSTADLQRSLDQARAELERLSSDSSSPSRSHANA